MISSRSRIFATLTGTAAILLAGCAEQYAPPPPMPLPPMAAPAEPAAPALAQPQLDQLVAPVALYADPQLVDILTASTYPLEVVEAGRWLADPANAALKGDALTTALAAQPWDPSVKALVPFPPILQMMNDHLDWTEHLGEAFLAQQADVMDAVQRLRLRAQGAGALKSSAQQVVANDGGVVTISPPPTQIVYVPAYDPWCVYGPWPYAPYPPYYFAPWPGYCGPGPWAVEFGFDLFWPYGYWEWGYFDWHHHRIGINRDRWGHLSPGRHPPGDVWQHDPGHRGLVPYRDPRNSREFPSGRNEHQSFRGFEGRDGAPVSRPRASAFDDFGSGRNASVQSQRGQMSRSGMSAGPSMRGGSGRGGSGGGRH